jgi:hypothetical protein
MLQNLPVQRMAAKFLRYIVHLFCQPNLFYISYSCFSFTVEILTWPVAHVLISGCWIDDRH